MIDWCKSCLDPTRNITEEASSEGGYATPRSLETPVQINSKCSSLNQIRDPYASRENHRGGAGGHLLHSAHHHRHCALKSGNIVAISILAWSNSRNNFCYSLRKDNKYFLKRKKNYFFKIKNSFNHATLFSNVTFKPTVCHHYLHIFWHYFS